MLENLMRKLVLNVVIILSSSSTPSSPLLITSEVRNELCGKNDITLVTKNQNAIKSKLCTIKCSLWYPNELPGNRWQRMNSQWAFTAAAYGTKWNLSVVSWIVIIYLKKIKQLKPCSHIIVRYVKWISYYHERTNKRK